MRTDYAANSRLKYRIVNFDTYLLMAYLALCLLGLYMNLNISSVNESNMTTFFKQAIWTCLSLVIMYYAFTVIDLRKLRHSVPFLTLVNILLMVLVLIIGREIKGATRSFSFMGVNFQPSLFIRVMLVLYFAHFLDKKQDYLIQSDPKGFWANFRPLIIITLLSFAIILKQRHLSTIIISSVTLFSILWLSKIRLSTIGLIILIIVISSAGILKFGAGYRGSRLEIYRKYSLFLRVIGKNIDKVNADEYQIKESLISLSAGGLWGISSVFGQAKNLFLPESTTDYIYSVIGEEYGFLGALLVFLLYCVILFRGLFGVWHIDDLYLKLAGFGLTLNIFFNAFVNIGVAMSALPSTGVTLPFMSYGGTSLIANSLCIGLILNITAERKAC